MSETSHRNIDRRMVMTLATGILAAGVTPAGAASSQEPSREFLACVAAYQERARNEAWGTRFSTAWMRSLQRQSTGSSTNPRRRLCNGLARPPCFGGWIVGTGMKRSTSLRIQGLSAQSGR